jgi:sugar phosphate isomerase/epimerase
VRLEVDTYWAAVGGEDPVALLQRLGDRVSAIHVKDGAVTADVKDQVAVGSGSLPIRDILDAAPHALRVVELDDSRADRFDAVRDSFDWLVEQGLA